MMPDQRTRADSLREYLTGAALDGGAQSDPNASLGNYRSASEALSFIVNAPGGVFAGLTLNYASGGNASGDGTLEAVDSNTIRWKCAGGDYGAGVYIGAGQTKIFETDGDPGAYIRATRGMPIPFSGSKVVTLSRQTENVFSHDNVSSAEAAAGHVTYRATILVNENAGTINNVKRWINTLGTQRAVQVPVLGSSGAGVITAQASLADWPESGMCHIRNSGGTTTEIVYYSSRTDTVLTVPAGGRGQLGTSAVAMSATDTIVPVPPVLIGIDSAGVQAWGSNIQTIANETTAPTGITWSSGISSSTGLNIGNMTSGQIVGIWIARQIPAGAVDNPDVATEFLTYFDA